MFRVGAQPLLMVIVSPTNIACSRRLYGVIGLSGFVGSYAIRGRTFMQERVMAIMLESNSFSKRGKQA
jgi:hypothetical protein